MLYRFSSPLSDSPSSPLILEVEWAPLGPASSVAVTMGTTGVLMTSSMQVSSRSATMGILEMEQGGRGEAGRRRGGGYERSKESRRGSDFSRNREERDSDNVL